VAWSGVHVFDYRAATRGRGKKNMGEGAMMIYGVSQTSGAERLLEVERAGEGVQLTILDSVGNVERERIVVPGDNLLSTIVEPTAGGTTIDGTSAVHGTRKLLEIEIRRNEVLLRAHTEAEDGWDVAVGLDDFQDALEGVVTAG